MTFTTDRYTICIHATARGDYDAAADIAAAMEKAGKRAGAKDLMVEILEQEAGRS